MQNGNGKVYEIDLDGVLCTNTNGDYTNAIPLINNIIKVNKLYKDGNIIIINTARGSTTGINWYNLTLSQLNLWGIFFHELYVGQKRHYDYIVDDKAINSEKDEWSV